MKGYSDPYARVRIVGDTNKDNEDHNNQKNCKHPPPQYSNESIGLN